MSRPAVSIIMSVFNDAPFVGAAIGSLLDQTFDNFELLVIDDHSTDGSDRVIADVAATDQRIRILPPGPKGRVPALNRLLAEARAPWIALMDSDDLCRNDRLSAQMAFLTANPDHGVVSCECWLIDEKGLPIERPPIQRPLTHDAIIANLESGPLLNHNAVIYARSAIEAIGGYRSPFRHAEDYDLWLRLSCVTRMANLPDKLMAYRVYPGQVSMRHVVEQTRNAAIAWLCHSEVIAGRIDPAANKASLPDLDALDSMFGTGSADYVARRVLNRIAHAPDVIAGDGWPEARRHLRASRADRDLLRIVARLARKGHLMRALQAGAALAGGRS